MHSLLLLAKVHTKREFYVRTSCSTRFRFLEDNDAHIIATFSGKDTIK